MKVWITKYALSTGIYTLEVEEPDSKSPGMIFHRFLLHDSYYHGEGRDWHRSQDAAVNKAKAMAAAKVKSLKKSLLQMQALCDEPRFREEKK